MWLGFQHLGLLGVVFRGYRIPNSGVCKIVCWYFQGHNNEIAEGFNYMLMENMNR